MNLLKRKRTSSGDDDTTPRPMDRLTTPALIYKLNAYCLAEIFKYLSPIDIANMSVASIQLWHNTAPYRKRALFKLDKSNYITDLAYIYMNRYNIDDESFRFSLTNEKGLPNDDKLVWDLLSNPRVDTLELDYDVDCSKSPIANNTNIRTLKLDVSKCKNGGPITKCPNLETLVVTCRSRASENVKIFCRPYYAYQKMRSIGLDLLHLNNLKHLDLTNVELADLINDRYVTYPFRLESLKLQKMGYRLIKSQRESLKTLEFVKESSEIARYIAEDLLNFPVLSTLKMNTYNLYLSGWDKIMENRTIEIYEAYYSELSCEYFSKWFIRALRNLKSITCPDACLGYIDSMVRLECIYVYQEHKNYDINTIKEVLKQNAQSLKTLVINMDILVERDLLEIIFAMPHLHTLSITGNFGIIVCYGRNFREMLTENSSITTFHCCINDYESLNVSGYLNPVLRIITQKAKSLKSFYYQSNIYKLGSTQNGGTDAVHVWGSNIYTAFICDD